MLSVVNTSTELIALAWSNESASDADFVGYNVYSSTTPGGPTYALVASTALTSHVVSGLSNNSTYYFVVRGADTVQESGNSPEAFGTTGAIATPNPTPPPACAPPAPPDCANAGGPPNGGYSNVAPGQQLILDLGPGNGILNGTGYDFVYYERERPPAGSTVIQMDWVTVELSIDRITWYIAFAWSQGNEGLAQNSNIRPYAISGATNPDSDYCDLFPGASALDEIRMNGGAPCPKWDGLWGAAPFNTGVAVDINGAIPPPIGEGYRYIRITAPGPQPAEVDTIERLN